MAKELPPTDFTQRVGAKLAALREKKHLTQAAAAERVGVSLVTWVKWERGERWPSAAAWERIVTELGRVMLDAPE